MMFHMTHIRYKIYVYYQCEEECVLGSMLFPVMKITDIQNEKLEVKSVHMLCHSCISGQP